jgi:hypothetical protein
VGVLIVTPGRFDDVHQLSATLAEPKRQAKQHCVGSGYFVERRSAAATAGWLEPAGRYAGLGPPGRPQTVPE